MSAKVAFEILYKDYYLRVFGLCRRLLDSDSQAEDATQEAFMRAYRSFSKYDRDQPFWQWIAAIASNHCIDLLRRRNRTEALFATETSDTETVAVATDAGCEELIGRNEDRTLLIQLVDDLPDRYRIPVVLAYFRELDYDRIAKELGISRNHVGVLLLRAKQQLRKRLAGFRS